MLAANHFTTRQMLKFLTFFCLLKGKLNQFKFSLKNLKGKNYRLKTNKFDKVIKNFKRFYFFSNFKNTILKTPLNKKNSGKFKQYENKKSINLDNYFYFKYCYNPRSNWNNLKLQTYNKRQYLLSTTYLFK